MSFRFMLFALFALISVTAFPQHPVTAVFVSGSDGYASFRIPAVIRAPNHDLLAFCEGRVHGSADFGNIQIVMKRSADNGRTWGNLEVICRNDTLQAGNPAPVVDFTDPGFPKGRIFLFYCTGNRSEGSIRKGQGVREVWYRTSIDNGKTWAVPVNITVQVHRPHQPSFNAAYDFPEDWRDYATTPGHAIQLVTGVHAGRILVPINHSRGNPQPHFADFAAGDFYTDDHGRSFHLGNDVRVPGGNEDMAAESGNDKIMMNIRNQGGHPRQRIIAISYDGGASWDSVYFDKQLPDPVCQGSILAVGKDGNNSVIAVCNDADTVQRNKLTLRIVETTWKKSIVIARAPEGYKGDFSAYSDLVDLSHKKIGILYERDNYKEIVFTTAKW